MGGSFSKSLAIMREQNSKIVLHKVPLSLGFPGFKMGIIRPFLTLTIIKDLIDRFGMSRPRAFNDLFAFLALVTSSGIKEYVSEERTVG